MKPIWLIFHLIKGHKYGKDQCTDENFEKEALELYGCTTPFGPNKDRICDDTENATKGRNLLDIRRTSDAFWYPSDIQISDFIV